MGGAKRARDGADRPRGVTGAGEGWGARGGVEAEGKVPIGCRRRPALRVAALHRGRLRSCIAGGSIILAAPCVPVLLSKHTCTAAVCSGPWAAPRGRQKEFPLSVPGPCASPTRRAERLCLYPRFFPRVATCLPFFPRGAFLGRAICPYLAVLSTSHQPCIYFHFSAFGRRVQWGKVHSFH